MIRAIHAGFEYSLRFVRLDGGVFAVKGSDGDAFESIFVNELLVGIGETFDVELPLDQDTIILRFVFFKLPYRHISNSNSMTTLKSNLRTQLMVKCIGKECREVGHVPYVDTILKKNEKNEGTTINSQSS